MYMLLAFTGIAVLGELFLQFVSMTLHTYILIVEGPSKTASKKNKLKITDQRQVKDHFVLEYITYILV